MGVILYGPTTIISTQMITVPANAQQASCTMIEVLNDSTYGLNLVLPGGITDFLPPEQAKFFASDDFYGQDIQILPMAVLSGTFVGLAQQLTIIGYRPGEPTPPAGTTIDLGKVVIVANAVNTVSGIATAVQNDGNPSGTSAVEATVQGDTASAVQINNNGFLSLGSVAHPGQIQVIDAGGAADATLINGGRLTVPLGITANLISAQSSNDVGFHVANPNRIVDTVAGIDTWQSNANGVRLLNGYFDLSGSTALPVLGAPSTQSLTSGQTLTLPGGPVKIISYSGNISNITMAAGTIAGQCFFLINQAASGATLIFSANVRLNKTITGGTSYFMYWDGTSWYCTS